MEKNKDEIFKQKSIKERYQVSSDNSKKQDSLIEIEIIGVNPQLLKKKSIQLPTIPNGHVRFLHISDTHSTHDDLYLPECDVCIHSGDFCLGYGSYNQTKDFADWFSKQTQCKQKVIIAGNHEFSFDLETVNKDRRHNILQQELQTGDSSFLDSFEETKELITKNSNFVYLEDSGIDYFGYKIWGCPWTQISSLTGFQIEQKEIVKKWNMIPKETDILVSHGPPYGLGDYLKCEKIHCGSKSLRKQILERIKPLIT